MHNRTDTEVVKEFAELIRTIVREEDADTRARVAWLEARLAVLEGTREGVAFRGDEGGTFHGDVDIADRPPWEGSFSLRTTVQKEIRPWD